MALFYLLYSYTSDIPTTAETTIGTFADNTIILSRNCFRTTATPPKSIRSMGQKMEN
jgi:hypothetical protein